MQHPNIIIIGSGIAGISCALRIADKHPDWIIQIITKKTARTTNTRYAQGGIAAVMDTLNDTPEKHILDTIESGKGKCDEKVVRYVVENAAARIHELIQYGVPFDRNPSGELALGLEGGHSNPRILHVKDYTGLEIEKVLLAQARKRPNINMLTYIQAIDLYVNEKKQCLGAYVLDTRKKEITFLHADALVIATGGSGQVFDVTTNPTVATGDGVAMAHRAGAEIMYMQYFQFHPTALYKSKGRQKFLISEAVRGYGAHLVNSQGKRFVFEYDKRGELATRDIVSAAIFHELDISGMDCVYIDCRHLDYQDLSSKFPEIVSTCHRYGYDIKKDLIPVVPAAHYQCGGIAVDLNGQTCLQGLYAIGECTYTGLHGTNRLASNSLLEALVYSATAAEHILTHIPSFPHPSSVPHFSYSYIKPHSVVRYSRILRKWMMESFRSLNNSAKTKEYIQRINELEIEVNAKYGNGLFPALTELRNMIVVARVILENAINQPEL